MTPEELKNSILQLAIQGKLVEQRPEEGTGEELYQQIRAYQNNIKVSKDELNHDSMDFDIPDNWSMVELNQLFNFVDYRGKTPTKISKGVFLITASNIRNGTMEYTRKEHISHEEYMARQSRGVTRKGDLLFTTEAPMGNAALCDLDECSCGQRIITFQEYKVSTALPKLYMYFILSPQFQKQVLDNCTGTTAKGIKADKLKHFRLPLPPYSEQKRVVAKIEELLPHIERYGKAWSKLENFNKRFPTDMQKSILQMAIQGKLVEQRPEEGTGVDLYKQIQAEKQRLIKAGIIKKEKTLPEITEDEKPFDIPESWKWVHLHNIAVSRLGKTLDKAKNKGSFQPYLCSINVYWSGIDLSKVKEARFEHDELPKYKLEKGDLLICEGGDVGRSAIWESNDTMYYQNALHRVRFYGGIDSIFYKYLLEYYKGMGIIEVYSKGMTIKHLVQSALNDMWIPLPPLAEQKRIVAKLNEILPLCERLKK